MVKLHKEGEMQNRYSIRYKVECLVCGRKFTVPSMKSRVPKHPRLGEERITGLPYVPCPGSGSVGLYVDTVLPGDM